MSYFDIIVGILLIIAAFNGLRKGLIKELAGLAALLLGIIFAVQLLEISTAFLSRFFQSQYMGIIAFLLTFIIIVVLVHFIAYMVHSLIHAIALGVFNRMLGFVFGAIKTGFIISIILLGLNVFGLEKSVITPREQERSSLYPIVKKAAPMIFELFDKDLNSLLRPNHNKKLSPATV
jgi:membrane protein required for colicin V production